MRHKYVKGTSRPGVRPKRGETARNVKAEDGPNALEWLERHEAKIEALEKLVAKEMRRLKL